MNKEELIKELEGLECKGLSSLTNADLEAIVALQNERNQLATDLAAANNLNGKLNDMLEQTEKSGSKPAARFKVGKETYELVVPSSNYRGKLVNATTLKENSELLQTLIDIKSGVIRKVE